MKKSKWYSKFISCIAALGIFMAIFSAQNVTAFAEDDVPFKEESIVITGMVVYLEEPAKALDAPSDNANVIHEFAAGDPIFKIGEDNGYIVINYNGNSLYIKSESVSEETIASAEASNAAMEEAVAKEFEQLQQSDQTFVDSYLRQQQSQKNALIWKIVIGVLVALFIIISVVIAIQNSKKNGDKKSDKNEKASK